MAIAYTARERFAASRAARGKELDEACAEASPSTFPAPWTMPATGGGGGAVLFRKVEGSRLRPGRIHEAAKDLTNHGTPGTRGHR